MSITEAYRNYNPTLEVVSTVRKLINTVPEKYLVGLDCVVLTIFLANHAGIAWERSRQEDDGSQSRDR